MGVSEACQCFSRSSEAPRYWKAWALGYIQLGQAATTLSGGETGKVAWPVDGPLTHLVNPGSQRMWKSSGGWWMPGSTVLVINWM